MEANPEVLFSLERIFLFGGAFIRTVDDSEYLGLVLFVMFCCTVIADQIYGFKQTCNFIKLPAEERKQLLPIYQVVAFAYDFEMLVAMLVLVVVPLELWMGWYVMRHIALRFLLLIALTATSTVQFMVLLTELIVPLMQSSNAEMKKQTADELKRVEKSKAELEGNMAELEEKYAAISLELSTTKSQCQRVQDEHTKCESSRRLLLDILKYKNRQIQELGKKLEALGFELSMMKSRCQPSDHGKCMEERWQLQLELKNRDDELLERNAELEHTCASLSSSELSIPKSQSKTVEQTIEEEHVDEMNEEDGVDKTQEMKEAVAELSQSVEAAGHRKCEEGRQQFLDDQLNKQGAKAEFHERFAALCSKVNGSTTSVGKNDRYYRTSSSR